jgi:hypothetical protein
MIASQNPPGFVPRTGAHDQGLGAVKDFVAWAADPISDRSVAPVETIERAVTVDLIATFEPQLRRCAKTDSIVSLLADSNYAPYDYLPVRSDDRIVGLLPLAELRPASIDPGLTAEEAMSSLDQSILIASDSGVLRYIEEAEASPCRLVLRHTQIAGIVTIADLQKLAVRPRYSLILEASANCCRH